MSDFFNEFNAIQKHGTKLPHWQQGEVMQFVTFRLGDAMPLGKIKIWKEQRSIWQKNYRDTLIRDELHFSNAVRYIRRNPAPTLKQLYSLARPAGDSREIRRHDIPVVHIIPRTGRQECRPSLNA